MNSFEYFFNNNDIKEGDVLELVLLTDDTKETDGKYLLKVNNKESFKDGLENLIGNLNFVDNNEGDSVYIGNMLENTYLLRKAEVIEVGDKLKMTINVDKEKLGKMILDCIELPNVINCLPKLKLPDEISKQQVKNQESSNIINEEIKNWGSNIINWIYDLELIPNYNTIKEVDNMAIKIGETGVINNQQSGLLEACLNIFFQLTSDEIAKKKYYTLECYENLEKQEKTFSYNIKLSLLEKYGQAVIKGLFAKITEEINKYGGSLYSLELKDIKANVDNKTEMLNISITTNCEVIEIN